MLGNHLEVSEQQDCPFAHPSKEAETDGKPAHPKKYPGNRLYDQNCVCEHSLRCSTLAILSVCAHPGERNVSSTSKRGERDQYFTKA